jgi:hypothetical protein
LGQLNPIANSPRNVDLYGPPYRGQMFLQSA